MLYRHEQKFSVPAPEAIGAWARERCVRERIAVRNELAFLYGDRAHGGPARDEQRAALTTALSAIDARLAALNGADGRTG